MSQKDKQGKVLIVAGSADSLMAYQAQLSAYTTDTALTAETAMDRIDDLEPDVIIIDEKLPSISGIELAQWVRSDQAAPHYYSILLIANGKNKDIRSLLEQSGADNACLIEQARNDLNSRIDLLLRFKRLQDKSTQLSLKLNQSKETIRDLEDQDSITRLYNPSYISARLDKEIRHAERFHLPVSLMIIAVDGFADLHQTKGAPFSIKLLQQFGNDLIHLTRADDVVGRSFGGEFHLILPETKDSGADNLKKRICDFIAEQTYGQDGSRVPLHLSFGLATFSPDNGMRGQEDLVAQAYDRLQFEQLQKSSQKAIKLA
jgi:diguanylate cyclase (GGDEF)-like protein